MFYYCTTFLLCKHGRVLPITLTCFFFFYSTSGSLGTPFVDRLLALFYLRYITFVEQPYHLLFFCLFAMARSQGSVLCGLGYSYSSYDIWSIKIMGIRMCVRHRIWRDDWAQYQVNIIVAGSAVPWISTAGFGTAVRMRSSTATAPQQTAFWISTRCRLKLNIAILTRTHPFFCMKVSAVDSEVRYGSLWTDVLRRDVRFDFLFWVLRLGRWLSLRRGSALGSKAERAVLRIEARGNLRQPLGMEDYVMEFYSVV